MPRFPRLAPCLLAAGLAASTACRDTLSPEERAFGIGLVSGGDQIGLVASQLPQEIVFKVVDSASRPVAGVRVNFSMSDLFGQPVPLPTTGATGPTTAGLTRSVTPLDSSVVTGADGLARTRVRVGEVHSGTTLYLGARVESAGTNQWGRPNIATAARVFTRPDTVVRITSANAPETVVGLPFDLVTVFLLASDRFGNAVVPASYVLSSTDSATAVPELQTNGHMLLRLVGSGATTVSVRVGTVVWSLPVRVDAADGITLTPALGTPPAASVSSLTLAAGEPVAINGGRVFRLRNNAWTPVAGAPENAFYVHGAADGSIFVRAGTATTGARLWWTRDGSSWSSIETSFATVVTTGNGSNPISLSIQNGIVDVRRLGSDNVWQPLPAPPTIGDSLATNGSVAIAGPDDLWVSLTVRRNGLLLTGRAVVWRFRAGSWSRIPVPNAAPEVPLDSLSEDVILANGNQDGRVRGIMRALRWVIVGGSSGMAAVTTRALSVENGQLSFSTERGVLSASILGLGLGVDERGWAILTGVISGPGAGGLLIETPTGWTTQRLPVGRSVSGAAVADASAIWVPMSFGQLLRIARR